MSKSAKGSRFERWVCNQLSLWWSKGDRDDLFWRTAGSGARSTIRRKKGKSATVHCGDVCATDEQGTAFLQVFAVEAKKGYQKDTIQDLIDSPHKAAKQTYHKWIEQAEASRDASGAMYWLVVCKRDKRDPLVMMPPCAKWSLSVVGHSWRGRGVRLELDDPKVGAVSLAKLSDFLENVTPEAVRALLELKDSLK